MSHGLETKSLQQLSFLQSYLKKDNMNNYFDTMNHEGFTEGRIHPTAIISQGAEIGKGVELGPHVVIGPKVQLGDHVKIGANAIIEGKTRIGDGTKIYAMATIGTAPQDLKYMGEECELEIGKDNLIREYANISIGTSGGGGVTRIGHKNLVMAYTHIAHDVQIGSNCIFANGVQIAGHVKIADSVVFGGMSGGHQFCSFGRNAMIGAGAIVVQDVLPFTMVQGDRAKPIGLNVVGLRRAQIKGQQLKEIKSIYRIIYEENLTTQDAILKIEEEVSDSPYKDDFIHFLKYSERGICR